MTGSLPSEHKDDNGKSLIDLELYADHGNQRYLFDFKSSKDTFFTDKTKEIRQKIIDSIAFLDTEPAQGNAMKSSTISKNADQLPRTLSIKRPG